MAATPETKCYTVSAYEDNGVKAKMIDLSNLIQTSGYEVMHPESKDARFLIGVCRPIQSVQYPKCNGSMACLIQSDPSFDLGGASVPLQLASIDATQTNLQIESDFPTVRFSGGQATKCDGSRKVKVNYICPSGNEVRLEAAVNNTCTCTCTCTCTYISCVHVHVHVYMHCITMYVQWDPLFRRPEVKTPQ